MCMSSREPFSVGFVLGRGTRLKRKLPRVRLVMGGGGGNQTAAPERCYQGRLYFTGFNPTRTTADRRRPAGVRQPELGRCRAQSQLRFPDARLADAPRRGPSVRMPIRPDSSTCSRTAASRKRAEAVTTERDGVRGQADASDSSGSAEARVHRLSH